MRLVIDPRSSVAPYEQVRLGIIRLIDTGALHPADRLPTVRDLAAQLGLANNTIAKAYRELEMSGVTVTRGRNGTFVASPGENDRAEAIKRTRDHVAAMTALGVGHAEMLAMLKHELERH